MAKTLELESGQRLAERPRTRVVVLVLGGQNIMSGTSWRYILPLICEYVSGEPALDSRPAYSLTPAQQRGLSAIIELTLHADGDEDGHGTTKRARAAPACALDALVREADAAFTAEASAAERGSLFSVDEGSGDPSAVADLRRRVRGRLREDGACGAPEKRQRAGAALVNAVLRGRSADFRSARSSADQFVELLGPWFGVGLGSVLALAFGGFLTAVDWLVVSRVLGARGARRRVPCACRLCQRRIVLGAKIGEGGFGAVWRCESPPGVVLKFVRVDLDHDVNALKGALDEARHLLELRHDHVVAYYDTFVHRDPDGASSLTSAEGFEDAGVADFACIAMEDCAGGTLLDHVASGVPFSLPVVAEVTRQCALALAYAHGRGVVHRDIKLENVFVKIDRGTACIKIGDFGLAVRDGARGASHTYEAGGAATSSSVGGTEVYQPPECFDVDSDDDDDRAALAPAVDAWGLGCVLYEMATSQSLPTEPPFFGMLLNDGDARRHRAAVLERFRDGVETAALAAAQDRGDSPRARAVRAEVVAGLAKLLGALFAKNADARPALNDVAKLPCLGRYKKTRLAEFFLFTTKSFGDAATFRRSRAPMSRAYRAKSLPKRGARRSATPPADRVVSPGRPKSAAVL